MCRPRRVCYASCKIDAAAGTLPQPRRPDKAGLNVSMRFLGLVLLVTGCGPGDSEPPPPTAVTIDGIRTNAPDLAITAIDATPDRGGALIEASIGQNQHPGTKDRGFLEALAGLEAIDLALYKYCYVDVGPDTDPEELFRNYAETIARAPVRTVPVTLPLTTLEPGWKRWFKQLAGRPTQAAINAKRMRFNELIREEYGDEEIVASGFVRSLARLAKN